MPFGSPSDVAGKKGAEKQSRGHVLSRGAGKIAGDKRGGWSFSGVRWQLEPL